MASEETKVELTFSQADVDRERTQASKTARKNAMKDALSDPDIEKFYRERFENEAKMSAEERAQSQLQAQMEEIESKQRELSIKSNTLLAREQLLELGFTGDSLDPILGFVVADDADTTKENIDKFSNMFKSTLDNKVSEVKREILASSDTPQSGQTEVTPEGKYRNMLEQAKAIGDPTQRARAEMLISLEAQNEGITL